MERDPGNPLRGPVFVTGATGFVGRHVVRRLQRQGFGVRALTRDPARQPFDSSIEVVAGDLTRPETYAAGLAGASAVVHCALTENYAADTTATAALLDLAAQTGIRKFIHLSSIVIYGNPQRGVITEDTPPLPTADAYTRTKLAIEDVLRAQPKVPELAVLRLGCVYGPGGGWWSAGILNLMRQGRMVLVDGGSGAANLIHVEDVATLILLLLGRDNPPCDVFNVTDGMPVAWSRYFAGLESILGRGATVSMTAAEAREHGRKWLRPSFARRLLRKAQGTRRIHPLEENSIAWLTSTAVYSNRKAAEALGFRPTFDLNKGIDSLRQGAAT